MKVEMIDFEDLTKKFDDVMEKKAWQTFVKKFKKAKKIYLIANGGLHFTAAHAATDCTRLIPEKTCFSMDTTGFITSCANDYGYENLFVRWLTTSLPEEEKGESLVIGMSCSGNSKNVTRCLSWADSNGIDTFMISGRQSKRLDKNVKELDLECKYFHTVEVLCLILFYQMVHEMGYACPSILKEVERKDPWAV